MENKATEIQMVAITEIKPNPKNNNKHNKEGIKRLAKNIAEIGFRNPLIISKRSGFLIAGHGRLEAAKDLGLTELPVIYQDFKNDAEEYVHMTADNALADWSALDFGQINVDIGEIGPFDVELLGLKKFNVDVFENESINIEPKEQQFIVALICKTEPEMKDIFNEMQHRGIECKLIT